jgi:exopolysaccharide biosynthesis polyprenyl glycosylphosphotransferase
MFWGPAHHRLIFQIADAVTTLVSFAVAYYLWQLLVLSSWLRFGSDIVLNSAIYLLIGIASIIWVIIFWCYDAYSYQRFTSFSTEIKIILKTVLLGILLLLSLLFLIQPGYIPRTLVILFALVNCALLALEKLLLFMIAHFVRLRGHNRKTVLVIGTGDQTKRFMEAIAKNYSWGLDIIGFLDPSAANVGQEIFGKKILGSFEDITTVLHAHQLDEVIFTVSTKRMAEIRNALEACEREGVPVLIVSDFLGKIAKTFRADIIYGLPIIGIRYATDPGPSLFVKRLMDIFISLLLLLIFSPVFLIIAIAIKVTSPGPVLYKLNVMGFNRKTFNIWKFRTMLVGAEKMKEQLIALNEIEGPVFKMKNDPRVTPLGRYLRKYSLDELPQLWSVLKGDLSLVGPRAPGPHEVERFESWQRRKLSIKPGLSCLWQINGRSEITRFDDWVKMDLEYIDNWSLWLDIKILWKTIPVVISGKGAC